jgi:hypothetical protein
MANKGRWHDVHVNPNPRLSFTHIMQGLRPEPDVIVRQPIDIPVFETPEFRQKVRTKLARVKARQEEIAGNRNRGCIPRQERAGIITPPEVIPHVPDPTEGREYRSRYGVAFKKRSSAKPESNEQHVVYSNTLMSGGRAWVQRKPKGMK